MGQTWSSTTPDEDNVWDDDLDSVRAKLETLKSNFSGTAAPSNPVEGMLWADTDDDILKVYTGGAWVNVFKWSTSQYYIGAGLITATMISSSARKPSLVTSQAITPASVNGVTAASLQFAAQNAVAGMICVEKQTPSAVGSITLTSIDAPGLYRVMATLENSDYSSNPWWMRLNNDSGNNYSYTSVQRLAGTSAEKVTTQKPSDGIVLNFDTDCDDVFGAMLDFMVGTYPGDNTFAFIRGQASFLTNYSYAMLGIDFDGGYDGASAITSLLIDSDAGNFTGTVYVFKIA
jgi:hypothetical protein